MNKEIYFCVDMGSFSRIFRSHPKGGNSMNFEGTDDMIKYDEQFIVTTSMAHFSFNLLDRGYDIYLCYRDKIVKIEPHMDLSGIGEAGKDLTKSHNLLKLFMGGVFDELL